MSTNAGASKSEATGARSKGNAAVDLVGLNTVLDVVVAGVLRPRLETPEGGGGSRPFYKNNMIFCIQYFLNQKHKLKKMLVADKV